MHIHNKYGPLQRTEFENDKTFFAQMLEEHCMDTSLIPKQDLSDHDSEQEQSMDIDGGGGDEDGGDDDGGDENELKEDELHEPDDNVIEDDDKLPVPPVNLFNLENMSYSLFDDLARFLRTLPPKSKQHIWEHGVKIELSDGKMQVCDSTKDKDQVIKLLCDCIIV